MALTLAPAPLRVNDPLIIDTSFDTAFSLLSEYKEEVEDFEVIVSQEHRNGRTHVSFVKQMTILIFGYTIELLKEAKVKVSGKNFPMK